MMSNLKFSLKLLLPLLLLSMLASNGASQTADSNQTTVVFNPSSVNGGPFPTNALTVPDSNQLTGLRINLQDSAAQSCSRATDPAVCSNTSTLNALDGFSLNPRMMVCFSNPIDPSTLQQGITINPVLNHGHTIPGAAPAPVAINQVFYDSGAKCAFAKPENVLAQDTTYLLVVTDAVKDANGAPVVASADFKTCLSASDRYCQSLAAALSGSIGRRRPQASDVIAASVFTTMTASAWAQAARAAADSAPAIVVPAGLFGGPSVFNLKDVASMTWNTAGAAQSSLPIYAAAAPPQPFVPNATVLAGVGQIAFGLFESTNYLDTTTGEVNVGTSKNPLNPLFPIPVSFHVLLPSKPAPPSGYPVLIWGHGLGDNQFGASTYLASTFAKNGFAVLTIEVTGQGYGIQSTVSVQTPKGTFQEATPGRGVLLGNTYIGSADGCILAGTPIGTRDCNLQTVADLSAIVHALQTSTVQNVLKINLDPNRIYYGGQSEGAIFGTVFNAVEPAVKGVVLTAGGGTSVDIARLAPSARQLGVAYALQNSVENISGSTVDAVQQNMPQPDGFYAPYSIPSNGTFFNFYDDYPFRGQITVNDNSDGAGTVQAAFEAADWIQMIGDPLAFAAHLKNSPLPGVAPKPVLFLFSEGDLEVPNPTNSALIRAGGIQNTSWYLQFDHVIGKTGSNVANYGGSNDPHTSFSYPTIYAFGGDQLAIALAEQQQAARFLASNGTQNPDPNTLLHGFVPDSSAGGSPLFVVPATLPDMLNYFQFGLTPTIVH